MAKFKAILFDLDGTLVDSEQFHFRTWNEVLAESDVQLEFTDFLKNYAGTPLPANAKKLRELYQIDSPLDVLISRKERLNEERLKTMVIGLMPHVQETMDFFEQTGVQMALVTASPRGDVNQMFSNNGLGKYFSLLITRSDVQHSKPHPESYNLAVEKLGLQKSECLVFEDTLNGLNAAKAAGLTCFVIQANAEDHEKLAAADQIFTDFEQAKNYLLANGLI